MSRALRYAPPLASRDLIVRPRLLDALRSRFERPLTAVVAPAGFGKTTLLGQAVSENALSPAGEDRWLTCQRDDATLSVLASGAFAAVGLSTPVPEDPREAAVAVAEALWSAAPRHIALVLDDVHLVTPGSPAGEFLGHLVEELPRNGHLVLASRPPLPLSISRLVATGHAVVLREGDLQFHEDEVAAFAESRGVAPELLSDVGGWPALAELTATAGPFAVSGYVWEELLTQLSPERRHALALLVAVGGADDEIAAALLGRDVHLRSLLDGLPLVVRSRSGWWSLHGLWAAALQHHLDAGQVAEARRTAAAVLRGRGQYQEAMGLLLDAEAWEDVRRLVVEVCECCTALVPTDVLESWLRRLPLEVQQSPEGLLLAAMAAQPTSPGAAEELLVQALAGAHGDPDLRYACVNALVQLAFWRNDRRRMALLLAELPAGEHSGARTFVALVRGILARSTDEVRSALADPGLTSRTALNPVHHWLHAQLVLLRLGDAATGEVLARRALSHPATTMHGLARSLLVESFRLRGRLDEAERLLPYLLADMHPAKVLTSPELVTCAVSLLDVLGRRTEAGELLQTSRSVLRGSPVAWAPVAGTLAEVFHALSTGDEQQAAAILRPISSPGGGRNSGTIRVSPVALPLLYVLVPEVRGRWDADPPPGALADLHAGARALVQLREHGPTTPAVGALPPSVWPVLRALLPVPWVAELALGMVAAGQDGARALIEELGPAARVTLRTQAATAPPTLAATARSLLRAIPAVPNARLHLRVLGPLELRRDGAVVAAPELRRERVRQLLGYLLVHDRPTRTAITSELWPDLDDAAAGRNLRVTLTYLQNLLEPDRGELDPPYFLRSAGPVLHLVTDGALEIDVLQFERALDEAARLERQGAPSAALSAYLRAAELWGGDLLADVTGASWLEWERDRLRSRFVSSAVRAGNLLLARGDTTTARTLAERALRADNCSEDAHQLLVAVHLADGDLVDAHRALRRCQQMLRELGVPPQPRTRALAQRLSPRG
ncbi:BTAD domain-containing putative transcriptional regulator [Geodermatophilus poikilotrophus]|uniref:ATP-, maltotriose-and DNA-dependent transcriptional regulator MalT n=1 Tax=Geodermatophilus poikilotrophus TaxID=1333667 RepID=A0A1I0IQU0_9ACTN|nr:BTAD domain-containing putative transcriptional regulator [Geodermatophilus poikilotrophus]SET99303.1 ATP-, maltotriose-and DNA-dependent transcriptional regulator MalT [Geodermatophilus poikilotrophus]